MRTSTLLQKKPVDGTRHQQSPFFGANAADEHKFFNLPSPIQPQVANSLGTDLSGVTMVPGSAAAVHIKANAFTQGETVHFAPGKYAPGTDSGRALIGHELAHVVQQRQGRVSPTVQAHVLAINMASGLEAEADRMGQAAARGETIAAPAVAGT